MVQDNSPSNDTRQPKRRLIHLRNSRNAECESVLALIPAYSIGATDPEEEAFIKGKIADCPEAAAELAKYMKLAEALHYDASPVPASPTLAGALRTAIKAPLAPRPVAALPERETTTGPERAIAQPLSGRYTRLALVLAAAIFLLFLVSVVYWLIQNEQLRSRQDQILAHLHDQDTALMLIGIGASNRIELPVVQAGIQPAAFAAVVVDPQGEYALLYVKDFPALQPDQAYQVWLEHGGQQTSAGLFSVDDDGLGILTFRTSMPIPSFDSVEITTEPAAGSSQPTTSPIVRRKF